MCFTILLCRRVQASTHGHAKLARVLSVLTLRPHEKQTVVGTLSRCRDIVRYDLGIHVTMDSCDTLSSPLNIVIAVAIECGGNFIPAGGGCCCATEPRLQEYTAGHSL